jgi:hypothetical protein
MSGATPCHITYQALYGLAFAYNDIVKTIAVPIPGAVAHAFRESLIAKIKWSIHARQGFRCIRKEVENKVLALKGRLFCARSRYVLRVRPGCPPRHATRHYWLRKK